MQQNENKLGIVNRSIPRHNELGSVTAIATAAATLTSIAFDVFGKKPRTCEQEQRQIESLIRRFLTAEDRQQLVKGTESDVRPDAASMARFYVGGKDCKHKNVSPGDERFLSELPNRIALRQKQEETGGVPATSGSGDGQITTTGFSQVASQLMKPLPLLVIGGGTGLIVLATIAKDSKKSTKKKS